MLTLTNCRTGICNAPIFDGLYTHSRSYALGRQQPGGKASTSPTVLPTRASNFGARNDRQQRLQCRAEYEPFPFDEKNYHKCVLQIISEERLTGLGPVVVGSMIFVLESDMQMAASESPKISTDKLGQGKVLAMGIGGESLQCLMSQLEGKSSRRPLALELLWTILMRGQKISKKDWKLLHIAVVDMRDSSYIGRLFFGDAETNSIVWDCDCRPSDACWLALKTKCSIYMNKEVWDSCSQPWRDLVPGPEVEEKKGPTAVRHNDPEPVKRLKREMEVALSEEDYTTAARIRDHPYMMLARQIDDHEQAGRTQAASSLREQLESLITTSSGSSQVDEQTKD